MRKELTVYHGTRANPESIKKYGLLAGGLDRQVKDPITQKYIVNKETTLARVLSEFGLSKSDVPKWTYNGELEYEKDKPIHIHFETSFENAKGYADMGGEPAYCIRRNIMIWKAGIRSYCEKWRKKLERINKEAKLANGPKKYVVKVTLQLDDPRIEPESLDLIRRVEKAITNGITDEGIWENAMEIRYFGDIPPDKLEIMEVE